MSQWGRDVDKIKGPIGPSVPGPIISVTTPAYRTTMEVQGTSMVPFETAEIHPKEVCQSAHTPIARWAYNFLNDCFMPNNRVDA